MVSRKEKEERAKHLVTVFSQDSFDHKVQLTQLDLCRVASRCEGGRAQSRENLQELGKT